MRRRRVSPLRLLGLLSPADAQSGAVRKAVLSMVAMRRMSALAHSNHPLDTQIGGKSLRQLLEESEKVGAPPPAHCHSLLTLLTLV